MRSPTLVLVALSAVLAVATAAAQPQRPGDAGGPAWSSLSASQRSALAPLERDWSTIDAQRKQKWIDIAARMPTMPPEERARVHERMTTWARLSPQERGQARLQFQETRQISPQEKQARWQAYQALPAEQKQELAQRAAPPVTRGARGTRGDANPPDPTGVSRKSNIVPNPDYAAPSRRVAPTVVQGGPGATTTLMTKPATPPRHQQTGMPKIAAGSGFVDSTTLLPKRGPQAAATRSPSAPESEPAR